MKRILLSVTVSFLSLLPAFGEPVTTNSTTAVSANETLSLDFKDTAPSKIVEVICSLTGASSVAAYTNGAKIDLKSNGPITTAEAKRLAETALADAGYFTKTIGGCFVCVPKDRAWTVKSFTNWPGTGKEEKADMFYNLSSTLLPQMFPEFAALLERNVVGEAPFGFMDVHSGYITRSQAKMILEVGFAIEGYKVELVGDDGVKLVPLRRE